MDIQNIADAVATLDFLYRRRLMCESCGQKTATVRHSASEKSSCEECRSPHARYESLVIGELEKHVISALARWNSSNPVDAGGVGPGDPPHRPGG